MKKIASIIVFAMISFVASCAEYKEGEHYTKVSDELSSKPEIREFFSFYCPHCFKFEPFFADVKKQLPKEISFVRNHVDFLRAASPEIQFMLTKAVVVAKQLNVEEQMVGKLFNYIHVQRASFASERDIRNVFVLNGVEPANFDKAFNSFSTNSIAKQMKKTQDFYANKRAITGVPATIVNGKYRINIQALKNSSNEAAIADYVKLVKHLQTLDTF
ncbi:thiol:disulfide interchange protein DsbA/DsbL [Thalassotalea agariperforans]